VWRSRWRRGYASWRNLWGRAIQNRSGTWLELGHGYLAQVNHEARRWCVCVLRRIVEFDALQPGRLGIIYDILVELLV